MTYFLDYTLGAPSLANPDGSLSTPLPQGIVIGSGPGSLQGLQLPNSIQIGANAIDADISSVEIVNESRFSVTVAFRSSTAFTGRQTLVESARLPFKLELIGNGAVNRISASVIVSGSAAWRGIDDFSAATVDSNWHVATLVYDTDTLFLLLDGSVVACHGFGAAGSIAVSTTAKAVSIGGKDAASRFQGQLAALRMGFGVSLELETLTDLQRFSPQWFITTKLELSRQVVDMGAATSLATFQVDATSWRQDYQHGTIMYHSTANSAFLLYGLIRDRYQQLPAATKSALGFLVSDETSANQQGSRKSLFQGGGIYWSASSGAFEITGNIYLQYEGTGESSSWGLPIEPPQPVANGLSQRMQRATIFYRTGEASAHIVIGSILEAYIRTGGPVKWGFPLSDELEVKGVSGRKVRVSHFEQCDFYWSPTTGAHQVQGDIRTKWESSKGPLSTLGLPVTDEVDIPGGGRASGFEAGTITWYGNFASLTVIQPFKIFLGNLNTVEREGFAMGQNDLYFMATIIDGATTVFRQRFPQSGDFGGDNNRDVNIEFSTVVVPNPTTEVTFVVDIWDSDGGAPFGGGDDHLGTWTKKLNSANAWGLREQNGIFASGRFSSINNVTAAVHPQVNIASLTEVEKYWGAGARNRGSPEISYALYAQAFRDVDSEPEIHDPLDWLDKAFYEAVVKRLAKGGTCVGMSVEALYARKSLSLFSLPINRFGGWNQLHDPFTVKHQYQVGAAAMWWFIGQFLSGHTHSPTRVFNESRNAFQQSNNPVICISQNWDFSGAPHCVLPVAWDSSSNPWKMTIHDPNFPDQLRNITVDPNNNTWRYDGGSQYAGGEWSGGRMYYLPWSVLNTSPRTPVWDVILLLIAGSIIILGSDTETSSLESPEGADLSAHSPRAQRDLQAGRNLHGYFVNAPMMMGDGDIGEIKFTSGAPPSRPQITPPQPHLSPIAGAIAGAGAGQGLHLAPHLPLINLDGILQRFAPTNDFSHRVRGKQGGGIHRQLVKSGTTQFAISAPIDQGETAHIQAKALGTVNSELTLTHSRGKPIELTLMQRMGMSRDATLMKLNVTSTAAGAIVIGSKPGLGLIDIRSSAAKLSAATIEITSMLSGRTLTHRFDLMRPGQSILEDSVRLKIPVGLNRPSISISGLGTDARVISGGRAITGSLVTNIPGGIFGNIGHLGGFVPHLPHLPVQPGH